MDLQPFSQISSTKEFQKFMKNTIPFIVFTNTTDAKLGFSLKNPPIGHLRIRTQHWDKPKCEYNPL